MSDWSVAARSTTRRPGSTSATSIANPLIQWQRWYDQAVEAGCVEPHAFVLSTVDSDGLAAVALLVGARCRRARLLVLHQLRVGEERAAGGRDRVPRCCSRGCSCTARCESRAWSQRLPDADSDEYYRSRPRSSQIGAWASPQSQVLPDRETLEARVAAFEETFANVDEVPRPAYWGGWLLGPLSYEFWQGRPSRLHDRLRYRRDADDEWFIERLAP